MRRRRSRTGDIFFGLHYIPFAKKVNRPPPAHTGGVQKPPGCGQPGGVAQFREAARRRRPYTASAAAVARLTSSAARQLRGSAQLTVKVPL